MFGQFGLLTVNNFQKAGVYELTFDGSALASGLYFYRMESGNPSTSSGQVFTATKKMMILK